MPNSKLRKFSPLQETAKGASDCAGPNALNRLLCCPYADREKAFKAAGTKASLDFADCMLLLQGLPPPGRYVHSQLLTVLEEARDSVAALVVAQKVGVVPLTMSPAAFTVWARRHGFGHQLPAPFIEAVDQDALKAAKRPSPRSRRRVLSEADIELKTSRLRELESLWRKARALIYQGGQSLAAAAATLHVDGGGRGSVLAVKRRLHELMAEERKRAVWDRRSKVLPGRPSARAAHDALGASAEALLASGYRPTRVADFVEEALKDPSVPAMTLECARRILYAKRVIPLGLTNRNRQRPSPLGKSGR